MSFLVELSRATYPDNALQELVPGSAFSLGNARAMMWASQLAYETASEPKVQSILDAWRLKLRGFESNDPITGLPPHSACFVVAGGLGATIVAFSGTDPLKIEDWITDFTIDPPTATELHRGFHDAVETVWPKIRTAIENRPPSEQALLFTGHSLGGALTIIAAERAMRELGARATAVYTFGSPRTGSEAFFNDYTPQLGDITFRLVHGTDVVPTVPPALNNGFRHVGRMIQCPTDGLFSDPQTKTFASDGNGPDFLDSALQSGLADFRAAASFRLIRAIGPKLLGLMAGFLPRMVRDHIPANYFRALSIPLR
jgi:triacylglycerol lipase